MRRSDKALILGGALMTVAIASFFIFSTLNDVLVDFMHDLLYGGIGNKMVVVGVALLFIVLAIKIMIDVSQRTHPYMAVLSSSDSIGSVSINTSALERLVLQLTSDVKEIDSSRVFVQPTKKGIDIVVEIETELTDDLQVMTQKLQKTIKDRFEKGIGIQVLDIKILVKSLGVLDENHGKKAD